MNFDDLMKTGWTQQRQQSIEDMLRERLLVAETRVYQLEREVLMLRGKYPIGPKPEMIAPRVRAKIVYEPTLVGAAAVNAAIPTRKYVFLAFAAQCFYCRCTLTEHSATMDHQIPKSKGGRNGRNNLVLSCSPCNTTKGDRMPTPAELERAHLIRQIFETRTPNAEPIKAAPIDKTTKPNAIYTVRREADIETTALGWELS